MKILRELIADLRILERGLGEIQGQEQALSAQWWDCSSFDIGDTIKNKCLLLSQESDIISKQIHESEVELETELDRIENQGEQHG